MCRELADLGFDVARRLTEHFVDVIRLQEESMEAHGTVPTAAYASLGWIQVPYQDPNTGQTAFKLCYRSCRLVGSKQPAKYVGHYDIEPTGDYDTWRQLMEKEIIPYPALQLVLVAALSAVIVGLLSMKIPIENPIVHLNLPSRRGKSTAGYVAAATAGKPFDGTLTAVDEDGKVVEKLSLYQSWGATDNAMVATQAGNRGVVTVLNELGKSLTKNMTRLIFDLSEGSDKTRLNTDLKARIDKNRVHTKKAVVEKAPKSQAGIRTISIGHDVANALREAKEMYDEAAKKPGFRDLGYVVCKGNGEPFHPDSITQKWKRFVAKHNLPSNRLHDLRHSNATAMVAAGINAKVVQHRIGHADVSLTLNTYAHVLPEMDEDAANKLNQAIFSTATPISHPPIKN